MVQHGLPNREELSIDIEQGGHHSQNLVLELVILELEC